MVFRRPNQPSSIRLQKYLAQCGLGSRRACERLIDEGRVTVDGETVERQGVRVDPAAQEIRVDGKSVQRDPIIYLVLNKPRDVICTLDDPRGRRTIVDLLPSLPARVYNVGRLDRDSEGLLFITNDGELASRLMHPRHHVQKTYEVWTDKELAEEDRQRMLAGISDNGEMLTADSVDHVGDDRRGVHYRMVLHEGRNRQVRRMFTACKCRVRKLLRSRFGPLELGKLPSGKYRRLTSQEVESLQAVVGYKSEGGG